MSVGGQHVEETKVRVLRLCVFWVNPFTLSTFLSWQTQATALHRLVSTQPTAEDVREAIATNPGFVATADEVSDSNAGGVHHAAMTHAVVWSRCGYLQRGCTPLHVALASHAGMDVVKALIDANPETAGVADKVGAMTSPSTHRGQCCVACLTRMLPFGGTEHHRTEYAQSTLPFAQASQLQWWDSYWTHVLKLQ